MPATTPAAVDSEGRHGTNVGDDPNRESLDYRHGGIRFLVTKIIVKQVQWKKKIWQYVVRSLRQLRGGDQSSESKKCTESPANDTKDIWNFQTPKDILGSFLISRMPSAASLQ